VKVKIIRPTIARVRGKAVTVEPGQVLDVEKSVAVDLVLNKKAVPVGEPDSERETATQGPSERRRRPRRTEKSE